MVLQLLHVVGCMKVSLDPSLPSRRCKIEPGAGIKSDQPEGGKPKRLIGTSDRERNGPGNVSHSMITSPWPTSRTLTDIGSLQP